MRICRRSIWLKNPHSRQTTWSCCTDRLIGTAGTKQRRRRRALDEATERAMHRRNQSRHLINTDTILRDITPDDLRDQAKINHLRGAFIGHIFYPNTV